MKNLRYLIISGLVVVAGAAGFFWTKNNLTRKSVENGGSTDGTPTSTTVAKPTPDYPKIIGNFLVTNNEICKENGKPTVYFFGSSSCSHCVWEKPIAQKVFGEFKDLISYHENFDSQNDGDVFAKYSDINPGFVPFLVLGCKYVRVGAGETLGKDDAESKKLEEEALATILCKLTDSKPNNICNPLKDKVSQIK